MPMHAHLLTVMPIATMSSPDAFVVLSGNSAVLCSVVTPSTKSKLSGL